MSEPSRSIEPFTIHVDDDVLDDLRARLARTRFADQVEDAGWDYGTEAGYLRELVEYWNNEFDWRAAEAELNRLDHYRTRIDGQLVHFIHARSRHENAIPILILHGWPGSVVEFLDIIDPLVDPLAHGGSADDAFHVICPSLPGFGFSEPTKTKGWDTHRMALLFTELMQRLEYDRYVAQGGDFGSVVATSLAILDAEHCMAFHTNMPVAIPQDDGADLSESERADLDKMAKFKAEEQGYQSIQGTKPQSLGAALNDSPAGLAAWIVEKFRSWSDCNGDVESVFTKDRLLTNIMVYWVTQTITSSMRIYYESFRSSRIDWLEKRVEIPTGVARFPHEVGQMLHPRSWVEHHYNVTRWTVMEKGGHFAAMERPADLVEDVRSFVATIR